MMASPEYVIKHSVMLQPDIPECKLMRFRKNRPQAAKKIALFHNEIRSCHTSFFLHPCGNEQKADNRSSKQTCNDEPIVLVHFPASVPPEKSQITITRRVKSSESTESGQ